MKIAAMSFFFIAILYVCSAEAVINYEKNLLSEDESAYCGPAEFKFVISSGETTIWSNDGTSIKGSEPYSSIRQEIKGGAYAVDIGAPPMKPFFSDLLGILPNTILKTWIDTGEGFIKMDDIAVTEATIDRILDHDSKLQMQRAAQIINTNTTRNTYPTAPIKRSGKVIQAKIDRKKRSIENKIKKPQYPGEIALERFRQRAGDNGIIPIGALIKAKEHIDLMHTLQGPPQEDAGIWAWEWLGPGNIGGRIRTILIHPTNTNLMWIGSVSGGIWRTANGGAYWQPVDDFMANLNVTSLTMDPTNTDIMYAATGEGFGNIDALPGAGIFKSNDGGVGWTQLASTNNYDFEYVNRLAHHPTDAGRIFAGVKNNANTGVPSDTGVWESTDGGINWNRILTPSSDVTDIKLHPTATDRILVGCMEDVYYSGDGGSTWDHETVGGNQLPSDGARSEVAFSTTTPDIMYVSMDRNSGEIWRTTDGAQTWSLRNTGNNYLKAQGWYDNAIWVDPTNSDFVVVGGIDIWRSTDGGTTLNVISDLYEYHTGDSAHADQHAIVHHPHFDDGTINRTVYFGNDGGIQMASNINTVSQTSGWTNLANGLGITQFYGGAAAPDGSIIVGGTQDNDHLRYTPSGGSNWYQAESGDGGYAAVNYNDSDIVWGEYVRLQIEKSTNGGDSYFDATIGLEDAGGTALFIAPFSMDPNNPEILVAGGESIWRTIHKSPFSDWDSIRGAIPNNVLCSAIDIAHGNSDIIWVGYTDGHLARTADAGENWVRVDTNSILLPNSHVTDLAINPVIADEVFVTFAGYDSDNVWLTTDNGATWQQRTGTMPSVLPALQVNTVTYHKSNQNWVYIGTDLGIFASENKGITWSVTPRYYGNEGPVNVEVSELFWQGEEYLIAATHGRGMFRSRPLDVIYVDSSAVTVGDGSFIKPFQAVTEAVNAAGHGSTIRIQGGSYNDSPLTIYKRGLITVTNGPATVY